jgi:hypothetical protein
MRTKNTHPLEVGYLVMGLIFLGLAGMWALREAQLVELDEMPWLLPLSLIAAGVVGLVAAAAKSARRASGTDHPTETDAWVFHDDDERNLR